MVTSITQNQLLVPNGTAVAVGSSPTVVIALNYVSTSTTSGPPCTLIVTTYNGAQSALVVNTGSNTVEVIEIGEKSFPAGTIAVGQKPVAAVVGPSGLVYVANYLDGTVSEVNTTTLQQTRTIAVMPNPTSVSFDAGGNLWVGGQGSVDKVSVANWTVTSTTPVDGTLNQMAYSPRENAMVQIHLQNGTVSSPSNGKTLTNKISYASANSSYSTVNIMSAANGVSSGPTIAAVSTASYLQSPISQLLAFPAQTAFVPPILSTSGLTMPALTSTAGDVVAVVNGNSFTLTYLPSGDQLVSGTLPYPIRGVAVGPSAVYFTMPESNSVVTLPITF
jgi:YVTN family beta-propeller protein